MLARGTIIRFTHNTLGFPALGVNNARDASLISTEETYTITEIETEREFYTFARLLENNLWVILETADGYKSYETVASLSEQTKKLLRSYVTEFKRILKVK